MLDGIWETARAFKKREARRPVIIGIATNGPEYSTRYRDQVVGALTDVGASLSIVMVGPPPTDVPQAANPARISARRRPVDATTTCWPRVRWPCGSSRLPTSSPTSIL